MSSYVTDNYGQTIGVASSFSGIVTSTQLHNYGQPIGSVSGGLFGTVTSTLLQNYGQPIGGLR